jgi:cysteine desulfurase / selenocysteine lyase
MSTRKPGAPLDAQAAAAAGAPDPALIARLANELFSAWPGRVAPSPALAAPQSAAGPGVVPAPPGPSAAAFEPSVPPAPTTGSQPPPAAVGPTSAPAVPSVPPSAPPLGATFATPGAAPSDADLRLGPTSHLGSAAALPPLKGTPPGSGTVPQAPRAPADLPAGAISPPPAAAPPTGPLAAPEAGSPDAVFASLAVMPSADQLQLVPTAHGSPFARVAPFPEFTPPSLAVPAVPGEGFYFLDEGKAASTAAPGPYRFESLELAPESVVYVPDRIPDLGLGVRPFDPRAVRKDFPILEERVHGKPLIWLDNAATTQKPNAVIDRVSDFYRHENSNIHRAAHALAAKATDAYEGAREKVRRFLNAGATREIVFVRGTTEGINLVSQAYGRRHVGEGDEIVVTHLEHHANIVPWQMLCQEKGARLKVVPVDDRGQVILEAYERLLGPRTRLVAITQVSNALGTVVPVQLMTEMAHRHGARVLVDGAQSVSHGPVDVQAIGCDFFVFSGHKVFGPTGIGAVYGRSDVLDLTPPWQGGGNMIADVTFERTVYQPAPFKYEAGTGNIADAVGLGAALDYVLSIGRENIARYEHELLEYATRGLLAVPGLKIIGTAAEKAGVISFVLDGFRTEEVGAALDRDGIAVRSGHHCAQPILRRFGLESTVRASLAPYNTCEDVDALVASLLRIQAGRGHRGL